MPAELPAAAAAEEVDGDVDNTSTVESTLEDDEEGAEELLQARVAADSEAFDQAIKDQQREQGDRFEEMVKHEEGIRLGDEGWRERYYQVRLWTSISGCSCVSRSIPLSFA